MSLQIHPPPLRFNEVWSAFRILAARVEVKPGCMKCRLLPAMQKKNVLSYEEQWRSWSDLERRIRSDAYLEVLELMESSATTPVLRFEGPGKTCGMELVKSLRSRRTVKQGT